jgi:hypothetical protein
VAKPRSKTVAAAALAAFAFGTAGHAVACDGAGVITRIEGRPQDVVITRAAAGQPTVVTRPRILEVVCRADVIHVVGTTFIVLAIDGSGTVRVDHNTDYTIPARRGAPSAAGNAYRTLADVVMPDMKRMPWNVRIKGAGDDFGFALPALLAGGEQVRAGPRDLLVRLLGGTAPYKVEIRDAQDKVVAAKTSDSHEVVLGAVALAPGAYKIRITDSTPRSLDGGFVAVAAAPPSDSSYADLTDPEIRTAATATVLARNAPGVWSFEAELQLQAAPANGLDRDKVYELIESYTTD